METICLGNPFCGSSGSALGLAVIVDMFDTIGYLVGTDSRAGMLDEQGNMTDMRSVMLADACSTVLGALCGTHCGGYVSDDGRQKSEAG